MQAIKVRTAAPAANRSHLDCLDALLLPVLLNVRLQQLLLYNLPQWLRPMQASEQYTEDIDRADVVFVDDYCYMMSQTGKEHVVKLPPSLQTKTFSDGFDPQAELSKAYNQLLSWPRCVKWP